MRLLLLSLAFSASAVAAPPQLKHSDVVFMTAATDPKLYAPYGTTWVAWGTGGVPHRVTRIQDLGLIATGDLWSLTAGPQLIHNDPAIAEAVVRDVNGEPIEVPWQRDNTFQGTKTYFGCTNAPAFQEHLHRMTLAAVKYKPDGLHLDDPSGTYASVDYAGGCYCHYCMDGFRHYLEAHDSPALRAEAGVQDWKGFDYRSLVHRLAPTRPDSIHRADSLPLRKAFVAFQLEQMLASVQRIRDWARADVVADLSFSVNAYFSQLGSHFLAMTPLVTHFVAEVEHHAEAGTARLWPVVQAYRQAEAVGRPLAATASGEDYAWVKAHNAVNLVKIWIALSYASGQRLMVPHPQRQWCHTNLLGTHWYAAPTDEFAPYYQFVREHQELFDDHETLGPLAVRKVVGQAWKDPKDRAALATELNKVTEPLTAADGKVWVFPRKGKDGSIVVHLVNLQYSAEVDMVAPQLGFELRIPQDLLPKRFNTAVYRSVGHDPQSLRFRQENGSVLVEIPILEIGGSLALK